MTSEPYVIEHKNGTILVVKVVPNAAKNTISLDSQGRPTIRLTAPPVEGKANKELVKFIAKKLGVSQSCITIIKGKTSREKTLLLDGVDRENVLAAID